MKWEYAWLETVTDASGSVTHTFYGPQKYTNLISRNKNPGIYIQGDSAVAVLNILGQDDWEVIATEAYVVQRPHSKGGRAFWLKRPRVR